MLSKLVLPLLLMAAIYVVGRLHASRQRHGNDPKVGQKAVNYFRGPVGKIALVLVLSTTITAGGMIYSYWRESTRLVEIRVLDVETGKKTVYEALKGDVHGRLFITRDGRKITLADVERMEMVPIN